MEPHTHPEMGTRSSSPRESSSWLPRWHWRTRTQDLQSQTPATAPHSPSLLVTSLRFPGTSGHLDQPWLCSRAPFASDNLVPSLSSPGLCLLLPSARLHRGGWHAAPPRGSPTVFPWHSIPPGPCSASHITTAVMHKNLSFLLLIPSLSESALTHSAYSLSNSSSKFPLLITDSLPCLCRPRNPRAEPCCGEPPPSGCSGLPLTHGCLEQVLDLPSEVFPKHKQQHHPSDMPPLRL